MNHAEVARKIADDNQPMPFAGIADAVVAVFAVIKREAGCGRLRCTDPLKAAIKAGAFSETQRPLIREDQVYDALVRHGYRVVVIPGRTVPHDSEEGFSQTEPDTYQVYW